MQAYNFETGPCHDEHLPLDFLPKNTVHAISWEPANCRMPKTTTSSLDHSKDFWPPESSPMTLTCRHFSRVTKKIPSLRTD